MFALYDTGRKITKDLALELHYESVDGKDFATRLEGMKHYFSRSR